MNYEKPMAEVLAFDFNEHFMAASGTPAATPTGWTPSQGVNRNNVMDFLATKGVSPSDIVGGGTDALQINPSTHTVICSYYQKCYGHQFQWL